MKNTVIKMKNSPEELSNRFEQAKDKICELIDQMMASLRNRKKNKKLKRKNRSSDTCGTPSSKTAYTCVSKVQRKKKASEIIFEE